MVHQIATKAEFEQKLAEAGDKLVVVDFWATWCPPCVAIAPVFVQISEEMADSAIFYKVDVDANSETS